MSKRKNIGRKLRFEIFKRDSFVCQYCGAHPPNAVLTIDHITPVAGGGDNDPDNLLTACDTCNGGKGARSLMVAPRTLAERAAEVAEREAQLAGYSAVMEAARERLEADCWRVAEGLTPGAEDGYSTAKFESIKRFVSELGVHECLDAVSIAWQKKPYSDPQRFKYFCGACWRKIERRV